MRRFLAGDSCLLSDKVVHRHLTPEGSGGTDGGSAADGAFALVVEEKDGAMGEVQGGEGTGGVRHVGETEEVGGGFSQEKIAIGGKGLVMNGDLELGFD